MRRIKYLPFILTFLLFGCAEIPKTPGDIVMTIVNPGRNIIPCGDPGANALTCGMSDRLPQDVQRSQDEARRALEQYRSRQVTKKQVIQPAQHRETGAE